MALVVRTSSPAGDSCGKIGLIETYTWNFFVGKAERFGLLIFSENRPGKRLIRLKFLSKETTSRQDDWRDALCP